MSVSLCLLALTRTGRLPMVSPCLLPAVRLTLKGLSNANHLCTIRNDLHVKELFIYPVLISIYKVQYDLCFKFKVQLQVQQTPITYFDN